MSSKAKAPDNEKLLAKILKQFDDEDQMELAKQLVKDLKLEASAAPYAVQVEKLLHRGLRDDERFKLQALYQILNFHGEEEETEEEEEL